MISPAAMISLRVDIVQFCTMISKLRLGCGIFKSTVSVQSTLSPGKHSHGIAAGLLVRLIRESKEGLRG